MSTGRDGDLTLENLLSLIKTVPLMWFYLLDPRFMRNLTFFIISLTDTLAMSLGRFFIPPVLESSFVPIFLLSFFLELPT